MQRDQQLSELSARIIVSVQKTLHQIRPDAVLVHGDTATCLFATLAAFYERIPVGHVEAGLRTYDFDAPWPEEMNRRLADPLCRWCFAPTARARENLLAERIAESAIHVTGNSVIDALLLARDIVSKERPAVPGLDLAQIKAQRLVLVTGHRRESFGEPFAQFCYALHDIAERFDDTAVVYPVHLNPNVQKPVYDILGNRERVFLIEPIDYLPFVYLMNRSEIIITDSGGIQEEAPSLHKPVLVTRTTTERPEAVDAGLAKLLGTTRETIVREASRLLTDTDAYRVMSRGANPYGDGKTAQRILDILLAS
jgi:UDP-N-acetylglucosamine 2-epimerase